MRLERNSRKDPTRGFNVTDVDVFTKRDIFEVAKEKGIVDLAAVIAQKNTQLPKGAIAPLVMVICGGILEAIPLGINGVPSEGSFDNEDWVTEFKKAVVR